MQKSAETALTGEHSAILCSSADAALGSPGCSSWLNFEPPVVGLFSKRAAFVVERKRTVDL